MKRTRDQTSFTPDQLLDTSDIPLLRQNYHILTEEDLKPKSISPSRAVASQLGRLASRVAALEQLIHTRQVPTSPVSNLRLSPYNEQEDSYLVDVRSPEPSLHDSMELLTLHTVLLNDPVPSMIE